ncbi:SAM-dependent methyltransferase [Paenarthrobacter nicotinovorans]|uniref:SAM-dependent methyltransferase n=1 Tax=Micrococcaceae TaxID=1268 RepID=UPI00087659F9|nr:MULTISPECIES: class I SAM-dependent methyltransferase [Micrococcaceae]MDR6434933.1 SAM-dependent methyltransferase [Paenarthrobacter nicotinovorans]SCZ59330.1 Methyltransferase domain-containing protein [Arthrobacter sp. UNCCL28]
MTEKTHDGGTLHGEQPTGAGTPEHAQQHDGAQQPDGAHTHEHAHQHDAAQQRGLNLHADADNAVDMWDGMYKERTKVWSGNPNPQLVAEARDLKPGKALDLGCGEGADAIWLAEQGWTVTALDVSAVALERAAAHAAGTSHADRITWQQQDLAEWTPNAEFDLVSAQFLHSPLLPWRESVTMAAAAVAPGGTLLVVGHHPHGLPSWSHHHDSGMFFTPEQLAGALRLDRDPWFVNVLTDRKRSVTGPDGESGTTLDTVLRAVKNP